MACGINVSPFSEELLISKVAVYPLLYNVRDPDYKNIQKRHLAWMDIAASFMEGIIGADTCKKKWRNCRDSYLKYKREQKTKTGQTTTKKKPYKFADLLRFLDDCEVRSQAESSLTQSGIALLDEMEDSEDAEVRRLTSCHQSFVFINEDSQEAVAVNPQSEVFPPPQFSGRRASSADVDPESRSASPTFASSPPFPSQCTPTAHPTKRRKGAVEDVAGENDVEQAIIAALRHSHGEDVHFAMSLVGPLQRMKPIHKAKLKLDIMKLIYEAEMTNAQ